jgi:hypothetical protein
MEVGRYCNVFIKKDLVSGAFSLAAARFISKILGVIYIVPLVTVKLRASSQVSAA